MGNCYPKPKTELRLDPILQQSTFQNTPKFVPPVTYGKVVKVYDGDTITIAARLEGNPTLYRFSVRLNGIDTPEMRGKTEGEKRVAVKARDQLSQLIMGERVELKDVEMEKYGRLLATVFHQGRNLNQWMLDQKLAVAYDGGTKGEVDWEEFHGDK